MKLKLLCAVLLGFCLDGLHAQKIKQFDIASPNGAMTLHVETGSTISWSLHHKTTPIIEPSAIALQLAEETLGINPAVTSSKTEKITTTVNGIHYIKSVIPDEYSQLTVNCKGDYGVVFRVYNDAIAYRFFTSRKGTIIIKNEEANFNFSADHKSFVPIQFDYRDGKNFNSSFEALYHEIHLSEFPKDSLAFLPVLVDVGNGKKAAILEADLEDYPGMYLDLNATDKGFKGVYAPYPLQAHVVGINYIPTERAGYIAQTNGTRNFPWRVVFVSEQDKDLLAGSDIIQKLASPSRLTDYSWVQPGQSAWDWWNDWNLTHVDFKAGVNTQTYKAYIDFAAANHLTYIIMDEGWSNDLDLLSIVPDIHLQEIIDYGKQKNVGVILWATWYAVSHQMDKIFPLYSGMGVKGFKIDFFDRDDQVVVASTYEIAQKAAASKLMVDFHGIYKPTGLQKTYPNVIGYEGVKGLENFKWANEDAPRYAVSIPFIRMMAGPMDYTPGAMRNANEASYRPISHNPISKGTRCQQLAEYVIFTAPFQMLADNPDAYTREQECANFITKIPTVFEETVPLDGKVGEYVALARRKGDTWYVGAMTNWTARDLTIDCSFLAPGKYEAEIFKDGINADRDGTDYKREIVAVKSGDRLPLKLYPGGGWVARIYPAK